MDSKPGGSTPSHTIPEVEISKVLGFVEILKSKGGHIDIYKIANELNMEFGETLTVIRDAELLKLVSTPGGDVTLESFGEKVSRSTIRSRKPLIKAQLEEIPVFRKISQFLTEREDHEAPRSEVLEKLAELLPNDNVEHSFQMIVNWGRYAELFGYNDDTESFYLDHDEAN